MKKRAFYITDYDDIVTLSDFIIIITYSIIKKTNVFFFFNDINVLFFLYDIIKIWDISMKLFITKNVMEIDIEFT